MKKTAILLTLALMAGSTLTGCSLDRMENQKKEAETETTEEAEKPAEVTEKKAETKDNAETKNSISTDTADTAEAEEKTNPDVTTSEEYTESADDAAVSAAETGGEEVPEQGWNSIVLYDKDLNSVTVKRAADGDWCDENGVSYGNLDEIVDESAPILNENGEEYYWNYGYAEKAGLMESGAINDPQDLYSWDEGTGKYIPYQQAGTDGSPVGQGKGWFYYSESVGDYLPW